MKHWLECLKNHLNSTSEDKREFILSLINDPLSVSDLEAKKYAPAYLTTYFLELKGNINKKKSFLYKSISDFQIHLYGLDNNGNPQLLPNTHTIKNEYTERIKEDLDKHKLNKWEKLSNLEKINFYAFYALIDLIIYNILNVITLDSNGKY